MTSLTQANSILPIRRPATGACRSFAEPLSSSPSTPAHCRCTPTTLLIGARLLVNAPTSPKIQSRDFSLILKYTILYSSALGATSRTSRDLAPFCIRKESYNNKSCAELIDTEPRPFGVTFLGGISCAGNYTNPCAISINVVESLPTCSLRNVFSLRANAKSGVRQLTLLMLLLPFAPMYFQINAVRVVYRKLQIQAGIISESAFTKAERNNMVEARTISEMDKEWYGYARESPVGGFSLCSRCAAASPE